MSTIVKVQHSQKVDATGAVQVYHYETDSDMVLIEGEAGVNLTQKLATLTKNRTISLSGGATGTATYNGIDSVNIDVEVGDDSHEHTGATVKAGTAGRVVITSEDESLGVSPVTVEELGFLSGVTSAIQTQLNAKAADNHNHDTVYIKQIMIGSANGVVPLDSNGKILAQYLPSYVDDVIEGSINDDLTEFTDLEGNVVIPETGKLYNDVVNGNGQLYRWGGTRYAMIGGAGGGVALGETAATAYRGDRGKIAYEHSQAAHAPADATVVAKSNTNGNVLISGNETVVYVHPEHTAHASGFYKVTVDANGHVTGVTAVTKADITNLGIPGAATTLTDLGIDASATELNYVKGVTSDIQTQLNGKAASSHGAHVTYGTSNPAANGTASAGTASSVSRSDHVHPLQTTVSGNAGTATKFASAQKITLTGDVTGEASSQAGWSVTTTLANSGVTAGSYGPSANATPAYGATFNVPYITVDAKGRVTAASTKTVKIPAHSHPSITISDDTTNTASPGYAGTFTAIDSITRDANGHVTAVNTKTVTMPSTQTTITGNAGSATKWATARNINGMSVNGEANRFNYGTCSTAADTAAKTVACTGFSLATGSEITVKFTVTNTAANPTLNVNSTGAKAIYYRGAAISAGYLAANRTYTFRYNGTQYELVGDIDTNTTYSNMTAATADAAGKAGLVPAPAAGKQASFLRGDGTWVVPTNTKNTAGSTNSSSKLFLIGATSQAANPQTYSHDTVYVGTDGCLYSNSKRVVNIATGSTQPTDQLSGDLWFQSIS